MKTLEEIKDQVAKNHGYSSWNDINELETTDEIIDDVVRMSNKEVAIASLAKAAENSFITHSQWLGSDEKWSLTDYKDTYVISEDETIHLDKESITSPDNIVTL